MMCRKVQMCYRNIGKFWIEMNDVLLITFQTLFIIHTFSAPLRPPSCNVCHPCNCLCSDGYLLDVHVGDLNTSWQFVSWRTQSESMYQSLHFIILSGYAPLSIFLTTNLFRLRTQIHWLLIWCIQLYLCTFIIFWVYLVWFEQSFYLFHILLFSFFFIFFSNPVY